MDAICTDSRKKIDAVILDLRGSGETNDFGIAADSRLALLRKASRSSPCAARAARKFALSLQPTGFNLPWTPHHFDRRRNCRCRRNPGRRLAPERRLLSAKPRPDGHQLYRSPSPSGHILRIAVAQRPARSTTVFPKAWNRTCGDAATRGETPDFPTKPDQSMSAFVFETDRPHLNEAALLNGTIPRSRRRKTGNAAPSGSAPALYDPVLQRAVDVVTSIGVFEKSPGGSP